MAAIASPTLPPRYLLNVLFMATPAVLGSNQALDHLDAPMDDRSDSNFSAPNSFHLRSGSNTPTSPPGSPTHSPLFPPTRFSPLHDSPHSSSFNGLKFSRNSKYHALKVRQRVKGKLGKFWYQRKRVKRIMALIALVGIFFLGNSFMLSRLQNDGVNATVVLSTNSSSTPPFSVGQKQKISRGKKMQMGNYGRLLALAAHALAEGQKKPEPKDLWQEPLVPGSAWKPCADQRNWKPNEGKNGYILVTANGGMNQQRVAVCNAVVVARLLNSTLVVPRFLFSSVWRDESQFRDIYQEDYFINFISPDIRIVKELPVSLQSLDLEAIGSVVTDADIGKEAKASFYLKNILPILLKNSVVHFVGFGNRLAFDPIPRELQIQETGALLVQRLRQHAGDFGPLDKHLVGPFAKFVTHEQGTARRKSSKYLAVHLRFEIDMVAHSLCEFGGGEEERAELETYRGVHFPALALLKKTTKLPSPQELRSEGLCPLTPEEAVLMLAALGFKRQTRVFVAGSQIYGGESRLAALTSLYPKLVTKEKLLSPAELEPFRNFSSQLAALDFIGCAAADAFAMTDSGSQLSSLVSGFRIYYGGGKMPTIRPNKRRLASIFTRNSTIEWRIFEVRMRKAVRQTKHIQTRPKARSVFRYPRCKECMCAIDV